MPFVRFFALLFLASSLVIAQGTPKRLILIEEFTSATCKPCVDADKVLKVVAKPDSGIIALKYHLNIPSPGDPFYKANPVPNDKRGALYAIPALPASRVNGYRSVDPRDSIQMWNLARLDQQIPYPVEMSVKNEVVSGNDMKVTVEINSSIDLNGYVLHAAVYTEDIKLPNIATTLPASNGQTEFASAMMQLLPDENGTAWNSAANEKKSLTLQYTKGTGELWNSNVHVIAFLQNPKTLEVIQAASSLVQNPGSMISTTLSFPPAITPVFESKNPNESVSLKAVIGNVSSKAITYENLQIQKSARTPLDWTLSVAGNASTFTLAPGATKEISLSLTRTATTGIGEVLLTFSESSGKTYSSTPITIISRESESFIIQDNSSGSYASFTDAMAIQGVKRYIPINSLDFMQNIEKFPSAKRFIWSCADSGKISKAESDFILNQVEKGVSCLISGQFITNNMFFDKMPLLDTLGVTYAGFTVRNVSYSLNGVMNDTISNGLVLACNPRGYAYYPLKLKSPKPAGIVSPLLSYAASTTGDTLAAVRVQKNTARMVYLGINPLAIVDSTLRRTLIDRSLAWIENFTYVPVQEMTTLTKSLDFGSVNSQSGTSLSMDLLNNGNANTPISSIAVKGANAEDFTVVKSATSIPAGGKSTVTVEFKPLSTGVKNAELIITPTNQLLKTISIPLTGRYIPSSVVDELVLGLSFDRNGSVLLLPEMIEGNIVVHSINGQIVSSFQTREQSVLLPILPSGLYYITVTDTQNPARKSEILWRNIR